MTQLCNQCRRANPREAVYCYFDGILLDGHTSGRNDSGAAIDVGSQPFPIPLVFPSGRSCHSFNQLALACSEDRANALALLRRGELETFLAALGRADLARAARTAARAADVERGFDDFLGRLPGAVLTAAQLRVEPVKLDLGTLRVGEDRRCELVLHNEGMRLLHGSARCDAPWLSLGGNPAQQSKLFEFSGRSVLPVQILGRHLHAYGKPQETSLVLESNGGTVEVPVRIVVPVKPFPEGVLSGAVSPRQVAHKAKDAAKEAAALIESGALARWYESNGWTYPVQGPAASGVAAVQQFLEALGLVKTPQVELSEDSIQLRGRPGQKLEYSLSVITQENRAAIAHGTSDQQWLQVGRTVFRGRCAFLPLTVAAVPERPGETLQARVTVRANGGQRFEVPVSLTVAPSPTATPEPAPPVPGGRTAAPETAPAPGILVPPRPKRRTAPAPAPPSPKLPPANPFEALVPSTPAPTPARATAPGSEGSGRLTRAFLILACAVALGTLLVVGWRMFRPDGSKTPPPPPTTEPILTVAFQDDPGDKSVGTATMTFGLALPRAHKRLTFEERGRTNNVCYRVDGKEFLLGYEGGTWQPLREPSGAEGHGARSVWLHQAAPVAFIQTVEIVAGSQSNEPDTCLIRYTVENRDKAAHKVGLRFLLDTFVGSRDGVPFTVPGMAQRCETSCDRKDAEVPDFLEALETEDLKDPGVVARLNLRGNAGLEAPGRVTVGAWPNAKLQAADKRAQGNLTRWDVPLLSLKEQADSAVTLYWPEKDLGPGARRDFGFTYGLGSLTVTEDGRLALSVGGAFTPGGALTVVAYVKQPVTGETLTLDGPAGWALLGGQPTANVPAPATGQSLSLVTWKVRAATDAPKKSRLRVRSSKGASQTLTITLQADRPPG